jgi:hypothetical protein
MISSKSLKCYWSRRYIIWSCDFRRTWIQELLHTAPWSALALWILWLSVWCGTESRAHSCSTSEDTACNWPECRTVWNKRMSWACVSAWWSMPSPWCNIHVRIIRICSSLPLVVSPLPCKCRVHSLWDNFNRPVNKCHLWANCLENVEASTFHNPMGLHGLLQG